MCLGDVCSNDGYCSRERSSHGPTLDMAYCSIMVLHHNYYPLLFQFESLFHYSLRQDTDNTIAYSPESIDLKTGRWIHVALLMHQCFLEHTKTKFSLMCWCHGHVPKGSLGWNGWTPLWPFFHERLSPMCWSLSPIQALTNLISALDKKIWLFCLGRRERIVRSCC